MRDYLAITKALSDEMRVRALVSLAEGELCVCQIIEMLRLAPSTVSKHLALLRSAGLIDSRKRGRWVYYRLAEDPGLEVAGALRWVVESLGEDRIVRADDRELERVKATCLEELCNHYANSSRVAA